MVFHEVVPPAILTQFLEFAKKLPRKSQSKSHVLHHLYHLNYLGFELQCLHAVTCPHILKQFLTLFDIDGYFLYEPNSSFKIYFTTLLFPPPSYSFANLQPPIIDTCTSDLPTLLRACQPSPLLHKSNAQNHDINPHCYAIV